MASRRSRIKGIANIPQRRKPAAEQEEGSNLKPSPSLAIKASEDSAAKAVPDSCKLASDPVPEAAKGSNNEQGQSETAVDTGDAVGNTAQAPQPPQSTFNKRRVKPAISLKAIKRSSTPASISPSSEDLQTPRPQEEPSPPENASYPAPLTPKTEDHALLSPKPAPVKNDCINKEISVLGITKLPLSQKQNLDNGRVEQSDKIDEVARPPPACSPSKYMNRPRIKAVPRLGQRRPSFSIGSASESEDESKKTYKTLRIRNDSVCSSVSTPAPPESPAPLPDAGLRKKTEFNSVIQRKCRRTEQSRKLAEARRDFQQKFSNGKPDRQKLTMIDLIFYNPGCSPMSQKRKRKDTDTESLLSTKDEVKEDIDEPKLDESVDADADAEKSDEENTVPAPQITIGANGEIIIDEKSLFIENKDVKRDRELLKKSELVDGDRPDTGYGVFKRVKRSKDWSKDETLRFYKALNTIGTDFTLMCALFPGRSRRELKMKFKKEERVNRALIDRAVMQPIQFDITELEHDLALQEVERLRVEELKRNRLQLREEKRLAKEQKEMEMSDAQADVKKKSSFKSIKSQIEVINEDASKKQNVKEALKNKLKQGIGSLMEDNDSEEVDDDLGLVIDEDAGINENNNEINEDVKEDQDDADAKSGEVSKAKRRRITAERAADEIIQEDDDKDAVEVIEQSEELTSKSDINENNNRIDLTTLTEDDSDKSVTVVDLPNETVDISEDPQPATTETANIEEGSIVVSTTLDKDGKESYAVFSVAKNGEKVPIDLNQEVLDVLLKNQKVAEEQPPSNADDSVVLPSDQTMDNIMADMSLSTIQDHPDLSMSTDCIIMPFEDIDSNSVNNSTANIVAVQTEL